MMHNIYDYKLTKENYCSNLKKYLLTNGTTLSNIRVSTLDDPNVGAVVGAITLNTSILPCANTEFTYSANVTSTVTTRPVTLYEYIAFTLLKDCGDGTLQVIDEVNASNFQTITTPTTSYPILVKFTDTNNCSPCDCNSICTYHLTARSTVNPATSGGASAIIDSISFTAVSSPNLIIGNATNNYSVPSIATAPPITNVANLYIDIQKYTLPFKILLNYTFSLTTITAQTAIIEFYKSYDNSNLTLIYKTTVNTNAASQRTYSIDICDYEYCLSNPCAYYYVKVLNPNETITYSNKILLLYPSFTATIVDLDCNC